MLKRTPILAIIIAAIISILIILIFGKDDRPFTICQGLLLCFISFFPSMGIAMLFDPYPAQVKARYNKINFYIEDEKPEDQVARIIQEENDKRD
ncbi:MAG: hypothetical protein FWG49_03525 [Leptospirales bacterium]|nr:hypothetical protein [Leptospirales bacterium]